MKKTIVIALAILLLVMPTAAFAGNWDYIAVVSVYFNILSNGTAQMEATISCNPAVNKIRMVEHLQRYESGSWNTIKSWSQYYYSNSAEWSQSYTISDRGFNYRLYVYYYVYNGSALLESTHLSRAKFFGS